MRKNKYNNKKVTIKDLIFDSKKESYRFMQLKVLEMSGKITELKLQPQYILQNGFTDNFGKKHRSIEYRADFEYHNTEENLTIVEDVKGMKTDIYKLKKKLFLYKYPQYCFIES